MTAVTLIGCGLLFLLEATLGMFWPGIYLLIGTSSRGEASPRLRLIGGGLFLCGVVCLAVGAPPREPAQWFLLAAGAALVFKGTLMIGFPRSLRDNPAAIRADSLRWKVKCCLRAVMGFALICWGVILLWPNGRGSLGAVCLTVRFEHHWPGVPERLLEAVDHRGRRWLANHRGEIAVPDEVEEVTTTLGIRPLTPVVFTAAPVLRSNSVPAQRSHYRVRTTR